MRAGSWFRGHGWGRWRRRRRGRLHGAHTLAALREGESGIIQSLDLPEEMAHRLMELGFLPGATVVAGRSAPGGDPRVYRVDGCEIALRAETTRHLVLKPTE